MHFDEAKETGNEDYRCWVYNTGDRAEVVGINEAVKRINEGWKLTPAELPDHTELMKNPVAEGVTNDVARDMNMFENIDKIRDKLDLQGLAFRLFGKKLADRLRPGTMIKKIKEFGREVNGNS